MSEDTRPEIDPSIKIPKEKLAGVILSGGYITLRPMTLDDAPSLFAVGDIKQLFQWMQAPIETQEEMQTWVESAIEAREKGMALPFVTMDNQSGQVIGSTRFMNINLLHRHLEIGSTWIGKSSQRSPVNSEAKYLMLQYAFEELGCLRVEFRTDSMNLQSQKAIERLGAVKEGILKHHVVTRKGRLRDTVVYALLADQWPNLKYRLRANLYQAN